MTELMWQYLYTVFALIAFAANSVLCRLALGEQAIDAAGFTVIRMVAAIVTLLLILKVKQNITAIKPSRSRKSSFFLFLYALAFSYAYVLLDTGTGALILFACVQLTMLVIAMSKGDNLSALDYLGILLAFSGLVYLLLPGASAPSLLGFLLMTIAGIAWALYTLAGKASSQPLNDTAANFFWTWPLILLLFVFTYSQIEVTYYGLVLAALSGAIVSAAGYAIWYIALMSLSRIQAAVLQLLVPVIAAIGGVLFANESLSARLVVATILVLSGVMIVVLAKYRIGK